MRAKTSTHCPNVNKPLSQTICWLNPGLYKPSTNPNPASVGEKTCATTLTVIIVAFEVYLPSSRLHPFTPLPFGLYAPSTRWTNLVALFSRPRLHQRFQGGLS